MKNWIELCSDVNWIDYHGMWAKKARDGAWYVLRWTNLVDAGGSEFEDTPYECEVKRLDLAEVDPTDALKSYGWYQSDEGIVNDYDGSIVVGPDHAEQAIVEACIQYGLGAPLESFTGAKYPTRIRANARRYAEQCMHDAALLEERLARPVNRIGSTAAEYGRGDINSALFDYSRPGTDPTTMRIIRKMHGMPEE